MTENTPPAETTRKEIAAKLKLHRGNRNNGTTVLPDDVVRDAIASLESSESLTGRAGNEGSGNAGTRLEPHKPEPKDAFTTSSSPRPDSGLTGLKEAVEALKVETEEKRESEIKEIEADEGWSGDNIEYVSKLSGKLQAYAQVKKLIEEREQASK